MLDLLLVLDCGPPPETVAPTCNVTALRVGTPVEQDVTVRDTGSGLQSITNVQVVNGTTKPFTVTPGSKAPLVVTIRQTSATASTQWSFDATDVAGNVKHCGPTTIGMFQPPPSTRTVTGAVGGPVVVKAGERVAIQNAQVVGLITVEPGGSLTMNGSKVASGIVANGPHFFSVCGSQIAAPLAKPTQGVVVSNANGLVRIGDPANGCALNKVAGDVSLTANTGSVTLRSNVVSRNVGVTNNVVGPSTVGANGIVGTLACTGNSPAPVNGGQPNVAMAKTGQCASL